jgi:hypothetical protein
VVWTLAQSKQVMTSYWASISSQPESSRMFGSLDFSASYSRTTGSQEISKVANYACSETIPVFYYSIMSVIGK